MKNSTSSAPRIPATGGEVYAPPFQAGSFRIESIASFRSTRFRPAICTGRHASASAASTNAGCASVQTQACMQPIEVPTIRRKRFTPRCSTRSRRCASTMSAYP